MTNPTTKRGPGRPRKYPLPEVQTPQEEAPEGVPVVDEETTEDDIYNDEPDYKTLLLALLASRGLNVNNIIKNEKFVNARDGRYRLVMAFDPFTLHTILSVDWA